MDPQAIVQLLTALGVGGALTKLFEYVTQRRTENASDERTLRSEFRTDLKELRAELAKHQQDLAASLAREARLSAQLESMQHRLASFEAVETECDTLRAKLNDSERDNLQLRMRLENAGLPTGPPSAGLGGTGGPVRPPTPP